MKYALNIAENNRILSATFEQYASENAILVDEDNQSHAEIISAISNGKLADYLYQDGEYVYSPIIYEKSVEEQIAELKAQLSSTDYKIIKCSEAQLVGEEMPYDIAAIHAERQAIRDKINALEGNDI